MVGGAYAPRHRWRSSIQHARLPSHRYLEEFSLGPVLVPYKVNTLNLVVEAVQGLGVFFQGGCWGPLCNNYKKQKTGPSQVPFRGLPGAFEGPPRGLPRASQRPETSQRPLKHLPGGLDGPCFQAPFKGPLIPGGPRRLPKLTEPPQLAPPCSTNFPFSFTPPPGLLQTSFRLSGPSAYTNEKVLLLTKMDDFRS